MIILSETHRRLQQFLPGSAIALAGETLKQVVQGKLSLVYLPGNQRLSRYKQLGVPNTPISFVPNGSTTSLVVLVQGWDEDAVSQSKVWDAKLVALESSPVGYANLAAFCALAAKQDHLGWWTKKMFFEAVPKLVEGTIEQCDVIAVVNAANSDFRIGQGG